MMRVTEHNNNIRFVQGWLKFTTYFAPILVIVLTTLLVINNLPNYFALLFWMLCAFFILIVVVIAYSKLYKFKYVTQFSDEGITLSDEIFMYNAIKCNDIIRLKMHRYLITYILLFVDDYKPYIQDQQFIKKLQIKWCVLRFGTPFVINTEQLEFMYKGVAQTIKEALLENNRGLIINEKFPFDVERKKL